MLDHKLGLSYGAISFFSSIIHNVFLLYHVETFVSIYRIDKTSFWVGETIFLLWNSFNDPLFGWLSDKQYLSKSAHHHGNIVENRLRALSIYSPLLSLAFLAFWIQWTYPWLQFAICLCVYDAFLTMVDLHHSSLLADLAVAADTRTKLNWYCSVFSALGSLSVFLSYVLWDRENLLTFQVFCLVLSVISLCGFVGCISGFRAHWKRLQKHKEEVLNVSHTGDSPESPPGGEKDALKQFIKDLSGHQNFMWFAAMNLVQVFHCHFNSNFFPLFLESLLGESISQTTCSIILGISFIAPHINNLYFLTLCRTYGVYTVIRWLFFVKLGLSVFMLMMGPNHTVLLCFFIASNRVFTEGTCKLLSLVIGDLVDEDFVIHNRPQAVSAFIFGTSALLSKPGQTLAPLIGTWLLSVTTGHDVFASGNNEGSIKLNLANMNDYEQRHYKYGVFHLLVYVPIFCAVCQLVAWSMFTLHGKRLSWVKSLRSNTLFATV